MKLKRDPFPKANGRIPGMLGPWNLENERGSHTCPPSPHTPSHPPRQRPTFGPVKKRCGGRKKGAGGAGKGKRTDSTSQKSVSSQKLPLCCLVDSSEALEGQERAWRGPSASRNPIGRERGASHPCGMPGVAKEKLFQVQLSYNLFFLTDHYCRRLYK